ncbi:MAG: low molecular weight protein arginine phosphatase [Oscillospiraceae bacterium]|nr:low molecular weight protein arginine phosphatase [Oscillospiraceae bacterium]
MEKILFVCSGNTCRSPMAEGIFNKKAQEHKLDAIAFSAGVSAFPGMPVTEHAVEAAREKGADISGHTAVPVSESALGECSVALCMTSGHALALKSAFPEYSDKIRLLSRHDISDPFGGTLADYERAADEIEDAVDALIKALEE